jgi:hypothetical protein
MLKGALSSIERLYRQKTSISCLLASVIVLVIDYITGKHIEFPIAYALPVGMAAWVEQKGTAYGIAILLPLARVGFHFPWHETQSLSMAVLNAPITVLALILYAYLVDRTAWQTRALEKKVRVLEGILPICASCKRIRDEKGDYEQIEKYITKHSEASFSHGICPECAKKLYPEYFKNKEG